MIGELRNIVGSDFVLDINIEGYLRDESAKGIATEPCRDVIVVKPASTEEVSGIMKVAYANRTPVYPRGGGTGLVGGAVPTKKGIVLSFERMKNIEVDEENLMCTAEAGVTLGELLTESERHDLFFPPHPGDEGAQVGGLVACNAGGSRAVKYGVMRNYVKGLEVVLADGSVLKLGGKLLKDNTGYDLMDLFIGSEGTLGLITKATLKLYPKPGSSVTLIAPFDSEDEAIGTVSRILRGGIIPLALEYVENDWIQASAEHLGLRWPCNGKAQLMMIIAESSEEATYAECERVSGLLEGKDVIMAERRQEQDDLLKVRSNIYEALKEHALDTLDVSVPPSSIGKLIEFVHSIEKEYGTRIPVYGHAADGNLHLHVMDDASEGFMDIKHRIYERALELGGAITAEHGIGKARTGDMKRFLDPGEIELMQEIKRVFDPYNIINPGTMV